jgi:hypothetical protein
MQASDVKSDCGFNMVPRIAVSIFEPRNHPAVELKRSNRFGRLHNFIGTENTLNVGDTTHECTGIFWA